MRHGGASVANLDALALWQTYPWLFTSNHEHVGFPCGKRVVNGVLDVYDVETSVMAFAMGDHAHPTHITTTRDHGNDTSIETDKISNLTG